jgi:hypothetical protein
MSEHTNQEDRALLRSRRERPRRRRAAQQRDELATPHSTTSSARARSVGGTDRKMPLLRQSPRYIAERAEGREVLGRKE